MEEILNEAALRCGKMGVSINVPREEQVEQLKELIRWALDGFLPHGIEAFRSNKKGSFSFKYITFENVHVIYFGYSFFLLLFLCKFCSEQMRLF